MSDKQDVAALVVAARSGDRGASEQLFRRFATVALRCAMGMCQGRPDEAEDLVQEVFVSCLQRLGDLREPSHFGAWLLRSLRNRAINRTASHKSRERATDALAVEPEPPGSDDPLEQVMRSERIEMVRVTFAALRDGPIKEAAQLYYLEGIDDVGVLATRLGIPKSTVTTRLDRFRQAFRKQLMRELLKRGGSIADVAGSPSGADPLEVM